MSPEATDLPRSVPWHARMGQAEYVAALHAEASRRRAEARRLRRIIAETEAEADRIEALASQLEAEA